MEKETRRRKKAGPLIPDKVRTPLGWASVRIVPELADEEGTRLAGQADYTKGHINIAPDQSPRYALRTYYHELTHYALEAAGLGKHSLFTMKQVEAICDAIATARVIEDLGMDDA